MASGLKKAASTQSSIEIAKTWQGPKGICTCGHVGDGRWSQHEGTLSIIQNGHGKCLELDVTGEPCKCERFSFDRWTNAFKLILVKAGVM